MAAPCLPRAGSTANGDTAMLPGVNKEQFLGFVRHVITFFGGILVARGKVDPTQIETISGVIVTVVGLVFSFLSPEKMPPAPPEVPKA